MMDINTLNGDITARNGRFGIAVGRFNGLIADRLLEGAVDALCRHGADPAQIDVVRVPGAFELPLAAKRLASTGKYDALIVLGCVIRGATPHFDYVAGECASGVARISLESDIPIGFGVLTVDSIEQAMERAGSKAGNKGADAALAALETLNVLKLVN